MQISWKLGRMAGIDLFFHPSALLVWFLAAGIVGGDLIEATPYAVALLTSITLHEYGHALMARHYRIETRDITLYAFGGIARLGRLPRSSGPELLIALAGPAVNFVIAATLLGVAWLCSAVGLPHHFLLWVLCTNLALGLFNLLPVYPMDGGRVLRALLSGWLGPRRATAIAATVGQSVALFGGVLALLTGQWSLALVAVAVYFLAGFERMQAAVADRFGRAVRGDLIDPPVPPAGFRWADQGDGVWRLVPILSRTPGWGRS